jgi:hypothetical protein
MICEECLNEYPVKDFLMASKSCFRCVYKKKKGNKKTKEKEKVYCKVCESEIRSDKLPEHRYRSVFCSESCYAIGQQLHCREHWTRKLRKQCQLYP